MLHVNVPNQETLGADIRAMRKSRGLTLEGLADKLGKSTGWLSQVERAISIPTHEDMDAIAGALSVSTAMLIGDGSDAAEEDGFIVRAHSRRVVDRQITGLKEELLSPDLTDDFEALFSTFAAGSSRLDPISRPTQELGIVISGVLDLNIGGKDFTVRCGDSFRIRGEKFTWANPHKDPAVVVWVIAPPVY